jgi:hypothetical protein
LPRASGGAKPPASIGTPKDSGSRVRMAPMVSAAGCATAENVETAIPGSADPRRPAN